VVSWSLVGVTTSNVQSQGQTFLLAGLIGPDALAPIAAGLVLIAPLRLAVTALISLVRPEFVAALGRDDLTRARRLLLAAGVCVILACLLYGGALWVGWDLIRRALFDQSFADQPMGLITWLAWVTALIYLSYFLPEALLEAAGRFRAVATATLASAAVSVVASGLLLLVAAPVWSMLGVIASEILTLWLFWRGALRITSLGPTSRRD